jgi:hypothetical protein
MRGRSTINFRAKTLFACSAKVPSAVGDRCVGIPATGRAVAPERRARAAKWVLELFYFPMVLGVALDRASNLQIEDSVNDRVRHFGP